MRRRTVRTKDKDLWMSCGHCKAFSVCPSHKEDFATHENTCKDNTEDNN